jgi:hypothetical protein
MSNIGNTRSEEAPKIYTDEEKAENWKITVAHWKKDVKTCTPDELKEWINGERGSVNETWLEIVKKEYYKRVKEQVIFT